MIDWDSLISSPMLSFASSRNHKISFYFPADCSILSTDLPSNLQEDETGIVGHYNNDHDDDLLNYTFQINLTRGEAFVPSFPRSHTAEN